MRPAETIRYDMVQKSMTARLSRQRRLQTQGRIRRMIVDGQHCYSATANATPQLQLPAAVSIDCDCIVVIDRVL